MSTPQAKGRRDLLVGIGIGIAVPAVSFLLVVLALDRAAGDGTIYSVGSSVWGLVAFAGTVMIAFDRTRRLGLGILLGFSGLLVVGAGTCTAIVMGGAA